MNAPRTKDTWALPRYLEGAPDPLCHDPLDGLCDDCGKPIPRYENMPKGSGFESQSINHVHIINIEGTKAEKPMRRKLCRECYLIDFALIYPKEKLPPMPQEMEG